MKNSEKPAYPVTLDESIGQTFDGMANHDGLTKRERFAMAAMQGILSNERYVDNSAQDIAAWSTAQADALLKELEDNETDS